jgi:hypothetical protein
MLRRKCVANTVTGPSPTINFSIIYDAVSLMSVKISRLYTNIGICRAKKVFRDWAGNPYLRGRISTVDLLVLISFDQLIFISSYLNEEVNCTDPFPSVSVPRIG